MEELATSRFEEYIRLLDDLSIRELHLLKLLSSLEQDHCLNYPDECEGRKGKMTHGIWDKFVEISCKDLNVEHKMIQSIMLGLTRTGFYSLMAGVTFGYSENIGIGQTTIIWTDFSKWIELEDE